MVGWQDGLVLGLVVVAAAYLARAAYRTIRPQAGAGCGSGCGAGCGASADPKLVEIGGLRPEGEAATPRR